MKSLLIFAVLALTALAGAAGAAPRWPEAPFAAPTDAEIDRVAQSVLQSCPATAARFQITVRCPAGPPPPAETRRIVETGMLDGAVEWCGDITNRIGIMQIRVRADGTPWDANSMALFVPGLHGTAKARGKALMQAVAPAGCSPAQSAQILAALDQYFEGDVSFDYRRWPAVASAPWPLTGLPRPTDAQVTAFALAAAGCPTILAGEYGLGPKDNGAACQQSLRLSLGEARRVVTLGLVSGAVRWCDAHPDTVEASSPWMVTLSQVSVTSDGQAWDPAVGQTPALTHGIAQGMARRLLGAGGKTCSAADRTAVTQAMLTLVQRDVEGGAAVGPARR